MKRLMFLPGIAAALLFSACSAGLYHMGGVKPEPMKELSTFSVEMFGNHSTQPAAGMLLTTALTDTLQRDGTYRLASSGRADFTISGEITHLSRESLLTNPNDTYLSREVALIVHVRYTVRNNRTGAVVMQRSAAGQGNYFTDAGNRQSAVDSALSQASRNAAEDITNDLTTP